MLGLGTGLFWADSFVCKTSPVACRGKGACLPRENSVTLQRKEASPNSYNDSVLLIGSRMFLRWETSCFMSRTPHASLLLHLPRGQWPGRSFHYLPSSSSSKKSTEFQEDAIALAPSWGTKRNYIQIDKLSKKDFTCHWRTHLRRIVT